MSPWHDDDHSAEPETSRKPSRADETERRLHELKRLAKEAELARQLEMTGDGPMTLHDVPLAYAELVRFHQSILRGHESPLPFKVAAAHDLQSVLDACLRCLLEQTQRIVAEWRGGLRDAFDDDERTPGCP